jgi:hypothetical protein
MVDLQSLWIGDLLLTKSQKIVRYEGKHVDGRARVKFGDKILLVHASQLDIYHEKEDFPHHLIENLLEDSNFSQEEARKVNQKLKTQIDLHIDVLAPEMREDYPGKILEYQILKCKEFIDQAIASRYSQITVIHGKGKGALKLEVLALVSKYPQIRFTISKHQDGAVELWIDSYR